MEEISKTKISRLPLASSFQEGDEVVFRRGTKAWRAAHSLLKGNRGEQGLDAFMTWKTETGNTSATFEEYALAIKGDKGDKGDPFVYADFTSEQLADLRLTWDKLTAEQKAELKLRFADLTEDDKNELKLHFSDLTEDDIEALQQPAQAAKDEWNNYYKPDIAEKLTEADIAISEANTAASAANEAKEEANIATGLADDAATAANNAAGTANNAAQTALNAADNVQDGKTTQFAVGTVEDGETASVIMTDDGVDETGNPKKNLNFTLKQGAKGESGVETVNDLSEASESSRVVIVLTGEASGNWIKEW
ncbi:MAG: hypothetical protein PHE09_10470 [Oscillospiraceae bacterium]|nr:hypothetical protein [Oscillospiraceae bacterium]